MDPWTRASGRFHLGKRVAIGLALLVAVSLLESHAGAQSQGHFVPPHSDSGVDTDGDGLYNFLRLTLNVDATVPGTFYLYVALRDASNATYITFFSASFYLNGSTTILVDLDGPSIRSSGIDGPYLANLYLYDDTFNLDDYNDYTTSAYLATDFDTVGAAFSPPHSDMGVDSDGNSLFDFLEVDARVNVTDAGTYTVRADLFDSSFTYIDSAYSTGALAPGNDSVPIDFTGWIIYNSGSNGPYEVALYLYDASFRLLDSDTYTTSAYQYTQFETPPAALAPPHSDRGVDSDGDGLFNAIAVNVSISVVKPGTYIVAAGLSDQNFSTSFGDAVATASLAAGSQTVELDFSTLPMVAAGVNGPYVASIQLYSSSFELLDSGLHTTAAYTISQFDPIPAHFSPPHSDMGVDRDVPPDGKYNVLELDVRIDVTDTVSLQLVGNLFDQSGSTFITSDTWFGRLSPGLQTVPLIFPGVTLRASGINGPYYVNMTLYAVEPGAPFTRIDVQGYGTQSYLATDFQPTTNATLQGTVRDAASGVGIPSATVTAYNYLNSYSVMAFTDPTGHYALGLFRGDWVVVFDHYAYQADLVRVTVTGLTTQDADLGPQLGVTNTADLTFTTWNDATVQMRSVFMTDTLSFRILYDWQLGNQDQFLDQQEFDSVIAAFGFMLPSVPVDSQDSFKVDGTVFDLVAGSNIFAFVNVTGPIDSTIPPEYDLAGSYHASATIPVATSHRVEINAQYDNPITDNRYIVRLPSPYVLANYTASSAVVVSGPGTDTATVDPGLDPDPFDTTTSEWVSLDAGSTDTTAPSITGTQASPNPVEFGSPVTISTNVQDASGISSVQIEIRNPTGGLVGTFAMSNPSGSAYSYSFTPSAKGTYTYTITATDTSGNVATATGAFVDHDTTAPTASAGPDQTVLAGTTVTFDGTGSSDLDGISTYTWTFNDNGAKTLTGAHPTYQFSNPGTYTVTLTVTDPSGNTAIDTVVITVTSTTGSVQGTVTDPNGAPVAGATVRLLLGATLVATTTTDASGNFDFAGVAPGSYTLEAVASGYNTATGTVTVVSGQTATKSLQLTAPVAGAGIGIEVLAVVVIVVVAAIVGLVLWMRSRRRPPMVNKPGT